MCALEDEADGLVLSELLASFPHLSFPGRVAGRLNGLKKWATEVQKWGGGFGGKSVTGRESKPQEEEERGKKAVK